MHATKPNSLAWAAVVLGLALCGAGIVFFLANGDEADRQAIADLQRQNEARRQALASRGGPPAMANPPAAIPTPEAEPGKGNEAAAVPVDTRDLVRRIDRLSEKLSNLERTALNLERRIVNSTLARPEQAPAAKERQQVLGQMLEELEAKRRQCDELFTKARKIAAEANVEVDHETLTKITVLPPALAKNQAFVEARSMAVQNNNLLRLLMQRYAAEKLEAAQER